MFFRLFFGLFFVEFDDPNEGHRLHTERADHRETIVVFNDLTLLRRTNEGHGRPWQLECARVGAEPIAAHDDVVAFWSYGCRVNERRSTQDFHSLPPAVCQCYVGNSISLAALSIW